MSPPEAVGRLVADAPGHPFRAWCWRDARPFDPDRLRAALAGLPPAVLRAKGTCLVGPERAPHLLQLAGPRWNLRAHDAGAGPPPGLVVIGTAAMPDDAALGALFAGALLPA
jgi:hypothetical protein